jgi:PAS domain-containing protein
MRDHPKSESPDTTESDRNDAYRSFFEQATEGLYVTTVNGVFVLANPALARIHGYDEPATLIAGIKDVGETSWASHQRADVLRGPVSCCVRFFCIQNCLLSPSVRVVSLT